MTPDKAYWILMVIVILWAISGVLIIINYLEREYLMMGIFTGMMILNAFHYTFLKKRLE